MSRLHARNQSILKVVLAVIAIFVLLRIGCAHAVVAQAQAIAAEPIAAIWMF